MNYLKYLNVVISLIIVFLVTACIKEENSSRTEVSTKIHIPKNKSELNDWQGFKITRVKPKLCKVVFPENYGLKNKEQLLILRELVNVHLNHDVDCVLPINYDALDHLKFLGINKQDVDAAMMIVHPKSHGGFNLDGELAEEYISEYQLAVLEGNNKIKLLLNDNEIAEELSNSLCIWAETFGEDDGKKRIQKLVQILKRNEAIILSDLLQEKCMHVLSGSN